MHTRYRTIARIGGTHGRNGEVVADAVHGLSPYLREGLRVWLVPPRLRGPRTLAVTGVAAQGARLRLSLSGVTDLDAASHLVGRSLLACEDDLPDDLGWDDLSAVMGSEVVDEAYGVVGTIEDVLETPANDLWSVRGPYGEVLVPVVEEIVMGRDERGRWLVRLPTGLVEVNAS